jgi:hypothetical protein
MTCKHCEKSEATWFMPDGRALCEDCFRALASLRDLLRRPRPTKKRPETG